jgi:hypothetical protein
MDFEAYSTLSLSYHSDWNPVASGAALDLVVHEVAQSWSGPSGFHNLSKLVRTRWFPEHVSPSGPDGEEETLWTFLRELSTDLLDFGGQNEVYKSSFITQISKERSP